MRWQWVLLGVLALGCSWASAQEPPPDFDEPMPKGQPPPDFDEPMPEGQPPPDFDEPMPEGQPPPDFDEPMPEGHPPPDPKPEGRPPIPAPSSEAPRPPEPVPTDGAPSRPQDAAPHPAPITGGLSASATDRALLAALNRLVDTGGGDPRLDLDAIRRFIRHAPADQGYRDLGQAAALRDGILDLGADLWRTAQRDIGPHADLAQSLALLDVELPARLTHAQLAAVANRSRSERAAMQACRAQPQADCSAEFRALTRRLVADPVVGRVFFLLLATRMALFPRGFLTRGGVMAQTPLLMVIHERLGCLRTPAERCRFLGNVAMIEQFNRNARSMISEHRATIEQAGNPWPADDATRQRLEDKALSYYLRMTWQGLFDARSACNASPRTSVAELDAYYACMDAAARRSVAANPAFIDAEQLRETYAGIRDRRATALQVKRADAFGRSLRRLGIAVLGLMALVFGWANIRRHGLRAGVALALAVLAMGATLAGAVSARHAVESAFSADTGARVHSATFSTLMSPSMRALISKKTEDGMDLVRAPLFELTPLSVDDAGRAAEVPVVPHLLSRWARLSAPLASARLHVQTPAPSLEAVEARARATTAAYDAALAQADWLRVAGRAFEAVTALVEWAPQIVMFILVVLYVRPLRPLLADLAEAGDERIAKLKAIVAGEARSLLLFLPILLVVIPAVGALLSAALGPLIRVFVRTALTAVVHLTSPPIAPSGVAIFAALALLVVLMGVIVLISLAALTIFIAKWREIVRARAHFDRPLGSHAWFWHRGLLAFAWSLVFPVVACTGLWLVVDSTPAPDPASAADLVLWPAIGLGVVLVGLVLLRVVRGLRALSAFAVLPSS